MNINYGGFYNRLLPQQLCRPSLEDCKANNYNTTLNDWGADIHLISTYVFLDNEEKRVMAQNNHTILFKQVHTHNFYNIAGTHIVQLESKDLVSGYMWRFRRSDVKDRNEWNNYSNLPYEFLPNKLLENFDDEKMKAYQIDVNTYPKGWRNSYITGNVDSYVNSNTKNILNNMGILVGGVYRENIFDSGVYNYIEKYNKTSGNAKDGLYCYNFGINNERRDYQPSGAMNLNRFKTIDFEFGTILPEQNPDGSIEEFICDTQGNPIQFRKNLASLYTYTYDLRIFEERYNVLMVQSGRCGLLHAT